MVPLNRLTDPAKNRQQARGRHWPPLVFWLLPAFAQADSLPSDWPEPYLRLDVFAYSEPLSIEDTVFHDWEGETRAGERQFASGWLEAGARHGSLGLGALYRFEYDLRFTESTAQLYGQIQNDTPLVPGTRYDDLWLRGDAFRAFGLRLSWRDSSPWGNWEAGLSALDGHYLVNGQLQGGASTANGKDLVFQASVDQLYSQDHLFKRPVSAPDGQGYALDLSFRSRPLADWTLALTVRDLLGALYWRDVPATTATANSDQRRFNEQGFLELNPLLSGREFFQASFRQRLRPKTDLQASYALNDLHQLSLLWKNRYQMNFLGAGWQYVWSSRLSTDIRLWPREHQLELGAQLDRFSLRFGMDEWRISDARTMTIQLGFNL